MTLSIAELAFIDYAIYEVSVPAISSGMAVWEAAARQEMGQNAEAKHVGITKQGVKQSPSGSDRIRTYDLGLMRSKLTTILLLALLGLSLLLAVGACCPIGGGNTVVIPP